MYDKTELNILFQKGINFLLSEQKNNGGFLSLSSGNPTNFSRALKFQSVFSSSLILQSLTKIPENGRLKLIKGRIAQFLLYQKSPYWSWNYWVKNSKEGKQMPYPDDLDDTFCALTALFLYNPKLITGEALAAITQMLISLETKEGGPYRTWLVNKNADKIWRDVDLGVNANIAYFLNLQSITIPNLTKFFDRAFSTEDFISPYYPNPHPILYFFSRFLKGTRRQKLNKEITKHTPNNPLEIALVLSSIINTGHYSKKNEELANILISSQQKDGSWKASTFYTGVNPKRNKKFFAGSPSLTTAIVLEALSLFIKSKENSKQKVNTNNKNDKANVVYKGIMTQIKNRFESLGENLQKESDICLKQIIKKDPDKQIPLLPLMFFNSLEPINKKVLDKTLIDLGAASVYGWIAYTIYDNFLDGEIKPSSLPIANVCLRELTQIFNQATPQNEEFTQVFQKIMDGIEEANTWEVNNCRFSPKEELKNIPIPDYKPDYKDLSILANRSLGHALGSVAILMNLGFGKNSTEVINLLSFFKHFLIAKQLNDDAHDWEEDLRAGQINSVGAILLSKRKGGGNLKELFWSTVIEDVCKLIELHTNKARSSLLQIKIIKNPQILLKLIEKQEKSVLIARKEKASALLFIKSYISPLT